jgi:sulfide:quinone oxidoreductase
VAAAGSASRPVRVARAADGSVCGIPEAAQRVFSEAGWPLAGHDPGMTHRIVILGAGTGGTIIANRLRRLLTPQQAAITVVDRDDAHVYQPGLLFVPFGLADVEHITRPRGRQLHRDITFLEADVDRVDTAASEVHLGDHRAVGYDVLVVATGARLVPEETDGMTGAGWLESVFPFYTTDGATALAGALDRFEGGRLVVNLVDMPIKCPVAPLEFAFLADWFLTERGVRDRTELVYVTPLDGAFTKRTASRMLSGLLASKHVELVTEFNTGEVDADRGALRSYDGREQPFDLLVTVPLHAGAGYVDRSDIGDDSGFVRTDPHTLQSLAAANVFAIGDATNLPTSKAGSVTHFEADTLTANILRFLVGEPLVGAFDGHANCFIETGFHKALLIDFNYEVEPLPGRYPFQHVGPLPLLRESRANHHGKLLFQWVYWHALLPGRDVPGLSAQLRRRRKEPV